MRLLPWKQKLAIDVGTATCHISVQDAGLLVREPTVIAFESEPRRRPIAYGSEAKQMLDREVSEIEVVRPLEGGVVADFDAAVVLLRHFIHQALGHRPLLAPTIVTGEPTRATQVERRALINALKAAGAGEVISVPRALAAAIGAGLPMDQAECRLIVDMGAGSTDIGVISITNCYALIDGAPTGSGAEVLCTDRRVLWQGKDVTIRTADGEEQIPPFEEHPHTFEDRAFIEAVRTGDPSAVLSPYADGLKTLAVTLACARSGETGGPITI